MNLLKNLINSNDRQINQAMKIVKQVNEMEPEMMKMEFAQMRQEVSEFRAKVKLIVDSIDEETLLSLKTFNRGAGLPPLEQQVQDELLNFMPRFYAFMREVMRRKFDRRHYDIQLAAGIILAQGQKLAEIKTGEGKTQIFYLPTFLYALAGRGSHSVTVNDYLTRRDGEYAGHIASELGLSVGIVAPQASFKFIPDDELESVKGAEVAAERMKQSGVKLSQLNGLNLRECTKKDAYLADITFSTNNELGFDYLRDNMAWSSEEMVQRELYYCAVDEADSILIDEARTPLIISAPAEASNSQYAQFAKAVANLTEEKHYVIDYKSNSVTLTEEGIDKANELLGVDNIWQDYAMAHHLENALKAKALFNIDDHYLVRNGEVLIVDSFTGRVLSGRRYSDGLHQAIEAKEGVEVKQESRTYATITFQNLFRIYKVLIGGSGTVETEKEEFFKIYGLDTIVVPTNRTVIRKDEKDRIYKNQAAKFKAVAREVKERYEKGQPVLVGTTSIERSELVSQELDKLGVTHQVLNAKYHDQEAQIVAGAGEKGSVTVATNMAGRGTDIPLGEGVVELGGLAVIGTERHEARRIDNQLRGRSGRQGDPGYSRFYVSMDDTIMKMLGGEILEKLMGMINVPEDQPIEMGLISKRIEDAQKRVEWANFDRRKTVVEYDDVMNQQREVFYARRRRILRIADKALGKVQYEGRIVAVAGLPEQEKAKYQPQVDEAKQELTHELHELLRDEVDALVREQFQGAKSLNANDTQNLIVKYLDLATDKELATAMDIRNSQLQEHLQSALTNKNEDEVYELLEQPILKLADEKIKSIGDSFLHLFKMVYLESFNMRWIEHLENMQHIREGIGLQAMAQKNPLVEYKSIAFNVFQQFLDTVNGAVAKRMLKVQQTVVPQIKLATNEDEITDIETGDREFTKSQERQTDIIEKIQARADKERRIMDKASGVNQTVAKGDSKVGRNDVCPCGSGKKFKKCGMLNTSEHQQNLLKA